MGNAGNCAERCTVVTASARTLPDCKCGAAAAIFDNDLPPEAGGEALRDQPRLHIESAAGWANLCAVVSLVYLVGMVFIWFCPETKGKPLPE